MFKCSTKEKKNQYEDCKRVAGFKIDMRILLDTAKEECDVGAAELAKDAAIDEILEDEGKDVIDHLVKLHITDNAEELLSFVVQLSGCQGEISSIHLASNGLYVAVPQFPLTFLNHYTELTNLSRSYKP